MEIRRPLKRPKLGPPDIYPQDPKQKEDELTSVNVKQGYSSAPLISAPNSLDEFGSAKNSNIDAFGVYFSALLSEKHRINTLKDTQKKKQLVNTKEIWYVHAKTKHAVDNWFRDLANGTKSLGQLGKRIPIFNSKEGMFSQLYESHVPLARAVWFIKMSAVHAIALSESSAKSKKRQIPDQYQELTSALTKYLKELSIKLSEYHHQSQQQQQPQYSSNKLLASSATSDAFKRNSQSLLNHQSKSTSNLHTSVAILLTSYTASTTALATASMASMPIVNDDFIPTYNQWQYQTQLARYLFDEGLLDQYEFLCFLLELMEKKRQMNDLLVKVICPFILEYVIDFSRSAVLSRRLAHVCARKLHQTESYDPSLQKSATYMLSSILQVICIECPTAVVRHHIIDVKFPSMSQGSPLDHLPCLPSNLPMMESDLTTELRKTIQDAEEEILYRSAMADSRWSCDSSRKISKSSLVNRLLTVIDILDKHNFDKIDSINSIEILYPKIFASSIQSSQTNYDEHIVKLLCEWATTTQRTGEHRALVVARLLEKRQQDLQLSGEQVRNSNNKPNTKIIDDLKSEANQTDKDSDQSEEYIQFSFQDLLVKFLDENAPVIDSNGFDDYIDNKVAFNNLILLFGELIRCDVFSHYNYMCTLISRGMFNDLSKNYPGKFDTSNLDSPAPNSIKPPKSIGNDSELMLSNTITGLTGGSNMHPLMISTTPNSQSNHLGSSNDQSLRSLGFSPVSSQQSMSQNTDKAHGGLLDNHIDDVDADLGKILQDIKEGQQDEADILLPDYLGENTNKNQQKLSPFGLENPKSTSTIFPSVESKPAKPLGTSEDSNPSENRHMAFVKHFPIPDYEYFVQDTNQRNLLVFGFGKEREDLKHVKKMIKEIGRFLGRKLCRDINDGGKTEKIAPKKGITSDILAHKFDTLSHHDQHIITNTLSMTIIEMFTGVSNGQSSFLPTLETLSFIFDLFISASNVSGLLELVVSIMEELADVEAQIKMKCPSLAYHYTQSTGLCIIGILYKYHSCVLLLQREELCSIFESLHKLVSHIPNPANCSTSTERVIFCYLYDLYSSQTSRFFEQYANLAQRFKQAIVSVPAPSCNTDFEWTQTFLQNTITQIKTSQLCSNSSTNPILNASAGLPNVSSFTQVNPTDITASLRQQLYLSDSPTLRQLNEIPSFRHRFVCDAIFMCANSTYTDIVNDIAVLCADVTSKCPALMNDWIFALQALCCSAQRDQSRFRQLTAKMNISKLQVMENISTFTAVLVARRCLELDKFIIQCAIQSILTPLSSVDKQLTEPGVRLTCHILLSLFRNREQTCKINSTANYGNGLLSSMFSQPTNKDMVLQLKYLCDYHLLRAACCSTKTEYHITLLKALRFLAMNTNPNNDPESINRIKIENNIDEMTLDGLGNLARDVDNLDGSPSLFNSDSNFNMAHINLQTASLHQFADAILRILCSQRWLQDKCLSDSEIFTTTDTEKNILIDPRLDVKQSQRLLFMICYKKAPEQADIGLDDQGSDQLNSIVKMFENLDVWSMRLSLMRLQFMFAYCKSQSNVMLNDWLDNLAKAVVDFFQRASQESDHNDREDLGRKLKTSKVSMFSSTSVTNIDRVWLIEPLLDRLTKPPSPVLSKIIKASAALMESASVRANSLPSLNQTYLSTAAASTKFKERTLSQRGSASTNPSNLASTSLLGFQPYMSLLLGCLKNQDKERETLLTSLNSQLYQAIHEKVDDVGYKQSLQDGLELRLCLIGQMFDTIQKSPNLTSDWATLLLLLIMNNLVDPQVDYRQYVAVLDMLATLIHAAYAADPLDQREESKKQYQNLMKKFRKELAALEEKGYSQLKLINPLMPLARQMAEVITCEPMGSLVDTKGEKVENFYSIDKKKGLKVSELQEVSPWDLIEGHKNPAPLSWPWFGAIRLEQKPYRADENNRLMSWHTHNIKHTTEYFCQVPNTDETSANCKRIGNEKKPSQNNPLLKSLIESNDESSLLTKKDTNDEVEATNENLLEDFCEIDLLFDSTPIETMIEDIKTAMAEQAALCNRVKQVAPASSILAPIQPDSTNRSTTPQVSALSALQNHLNASSTTVDSSITTSSGPGSVPPIPMSPIVNPNTPEFVPARPSSTLSKIAPTPPPSSITINAVNRSMSPMVAARSPAVAVNPVVTSPQTKQKAPRKKRQTKKDQIQFQQANVAQHQPNQIQQHVPAQQPPHQIRLTGHQNQHHQIQYQQTNVAQHQANQIQQPSYQIPITGHQQHHQIQYQQANVGQHQANQIQQQSYQIPITGHQQHHQIQYQQTNVAQHQPTQIQQQSYQIPMSGHQQHHQIQYQQTNVAQHQANQIQQQSYQIPMSGHQQQSFQHAQQQMFAPQQAAGHSRPALTAMLHQKHAAAGSMSDSKMHHQQQPRFNFG